MRPAAGFLALGLVLAAPLGLRGDAFLRRGVERAVLARAADLSCTAVVWAPALAGLAPAWRLASVGAMAPAPGWQELGVGLALGQTTVTAQAAVRVRLIPCVAGWTPRAALAAGTPLDAGELKRALFDPRNLGGPALTGPIPAGASATRGLVPGQPLLLSDVGDPSQVRAGQAIKLEVRDGGIVADDEGVLLDGGGEGSELRARHDSSGKVVRGRLERGVLVVGD